MNSHSLESRDSITVVSIATGRYLIYWEDLVKSFQINCDFLDKVRWVLLTDVSNQISPEIKLLLEDKLETSFVPHAEWPMPTLLRYKFMYENRNLLVGSNVLYLDADMKVVSKINERQMINFFDKNLMTFVIHPGYYRDSSLKKIGSILRDCKLWIKFGGIGNWETRERSQAYVPRNLRKKYFCGGIWGGPNESFIQFCKLLAERTEIDLQNGIVARFHDESHLNWFASSNPHYEKDASWCYEPTYEHLRDLSPIIEAVNKNVDSDWVR